MYSSLEKHISINKQGCQVIILRWILAAQLTNSGELPRRFHPPDRKNAKWLVETKYTTVTIHHYHAISLSPGLIFPRCLCVSGHVVRAICVSPGRTSRIRHQKALTEKAWEDAAEGLGKPWYTLFTPPPPFPPAAPALSLIFLGTTVILGRNWRQWLWKLLGDKQGYAYYGQCENGEFSPFNKTIWCLICFVVYQIYADTLWSRSHH